jgi:hypothetical protein
MQFVNDLHALISPPAAGTPLPLIFLGKVSVLSMIDNVHLVFFIHLLFLISILLYGFIVKECIAFDFPLLRPNCMGSPNWNL